MSSDSRKWRPKKETIGWKTWFQNLPATDKFVSEKTAFNQFSKGRGNVLSQVENLKTLGAKTSKSIDTDFENTEEIENLDDNLKLK